VSELTRPESGKPPIGVPEGARGADEARRLLEAYRRMRLIRAFEEQCLALSADVIAGSVHLCGGQEAIPVGARSALRDDDRVVATYRGHGWALEWGVEPEALLAEVCHRAAGINGGRAGSAYVMAPELGFVGENSIVGAGVPIAAGVALAAKRAGGERVVVVSIGDGAMNQGATHEGLNFAAMLGLPLVVVCENNGWSEMTAIATTTRIGDLAGRAAGYGIPGLVVDGTDPLAVADAFAEAAARARDGGGPTLLECKTVRLMAHYNRDVEHYRTSEEKEADRDRDPLLLARAKLLELGVPASQLDVADAAIGVQVATLGERVRGLETPDPATARDHVFAGPGVAPRIPRDRAEEVVRELTLEQAVNEALRAELDTRPEVLVYGEDVGHAGGIFGVTRRLQRDFGVERVFDTPISESAILGSALGLAIEGWRPVVEIMWADFLLVALDQLVNQAANVRYVTRGRQGASLVVRTQQGATPGSCAQHSQSLEALLAHVPGLRVGLPATPQDAYSMLRAAVADPDPVVLIEARGLYQARGPVDPALAEPAAGARLRRGGEDVAIVTWGTSVPRALAAADALAADGVDVTVLDLRWLNPLDDDAIAAVVERARGRVLVVHEANVTGGFGAEVAARISERHFDDLDGPVRRLGAPDVRMPASPVLQGALVPSAEAIAAVARTLV
jgi:2-oxoisovalerate dehydrogenase E1 component